MDLLQGVQATAVLAPRQLLILVFSSNLRNVTCGTGVEYGRFGGRNLGFAIHELCKTKVGKEKNTYIEKNQVSPTYCSAPVVWRDTGEV